MSVLTLNQLSKNYNLIRALDNITLTVPEGAVYGILGPNGSGKTTLLGIVMDVLKPTSGSYQWTGMADPENPRKHIGTLLETPNFYHYLSGQKNLEISCAIKGCDTSEIERVLRIVNLYERRHSGFNSYSLGMKQRLAIASALLGDPKILVFDEPTNGLDPAGIAEIRQLILQLHRSGKTIIMASHILDEVEKVCTHVAIIQKGVLKEQGSVAYVLNTDSGEAVEQTIEVGADDRFHQQLQDLLRNIPHVVDCVIVNGIFQLQCTKELTAMQVNKICFENGITLSLLNTKRKNLEARFLEITGTTNDE